MCNCVKGKVHVILILYFTNIMKRPKAAFCAKPLLYIKVELELASSAFNWGYTADKICFCINQIGCTGITGMPSRKKLGIILEDKMSENLSYQKLLTAIKVWIFKNYIWKSCIQPLAKSYICTFFCDNSSSQIDSTCNSYWVN